MKKIHPSGLHIRYQLNALRPCGRDRQYGPPQVARPSRSEDFVHWGRLFNRICIDFDTKVLCAAYECHRLHSVVIELLSQAFEVRVVTIHQGLDLIRASGRPAKNH